MHTMVTVVLSWMIDAALTVEDVQDEEFKIGKLFCLQMPRMYLNKES